MDYIATKQGLKLVGQGEAVVVETRKGSDNNHQVRIRHPELGETVFVPYIQTSGIYKVPAVGDVCYVFAKEGFAAYPMAWGSKLHDTAVKALLGARDNNITVVYGTDAQGNVSHKIELDDGGNKGVRVTTAGGNKIELKNSESISVKHVGGAEAKLTQGDISLKIGGSEIIMTGSSITIKACGSTIDIGASLSMTSGGSSVEVGSSVTIKAGDAQAKVDDVTISQHQHTSNIAGLPTTKPI